MQAAASLRKGTVVTARGVLSNRKYKLTLLVFVVGVAIVMTHAILGVSLLRQPEALARLDENIGTASSLLSANRSALEAPLSPTLDETKNRLDSLRKSFPDKVETTPFLESLFLLADEHNVALVNVQNRAAKQELIGQHRYVLAPFTLTAQGPISNLVTFTGVVQNSRQQTLVVTAVQLSTAEAWATLSLDLNLYTRSPISQEVTQTPGAQPARS